MSTAHFTISQVSTLFFYLLTFTVLVVLRQGLMYLKLALNPLSFCSASQMLLLVVLRQSPGRLPGLVFHLLCSLSTLCTCSPPASACCVGGKTGSVLYSSWPYLEGHRVMVVSFLRLISCHLAICIKQFCMS